jgi:hypothetical protein
MNIIEFTERFLPDYGARCSNYRVTDFRDRPVDWEKYGKNSFYIMNFPEALQNFADRICEAQKRKCGDAIMDSEYGYEIRDCENAIQPEIEDL